MRMLTFARRNVKEILRDPLNLIFMFGFPLVLILLLSAIQANVPVPLFEIAHLAPGVTVRSPFSCWISLWAIIVPPQSQVL